MIASSAFFVLDGILGWPVVNYDGSWSQWGQMSANSSKGGRIISGSKWITETRSESITYNLDAAKPVELLTSDGMTCSATLKPDGTIINSRGGSGECPNWPESGTDNANQIEDEDAGYMSGGAGGGTAGGTGPGVVLVGC